MRVVEPPATANFSNPDSTILDVYGLAALLGISAHTIPARRNRSPEKLPPPYMNRPLRWRRETVLRWLDQQEQRAQAVGVPISCGDQEVRTLEGDANAGEAGVLISTRTPPAMRRRA